MMLLEIELADRTIAAAVRPDHTVNIDDASFTATPVASGIYRVTDGTRYWTIAVAGPADNCWLSVNGLVARVEIVAAGARAKMSRAGTGTRRRRSESHDLAAPMSATVVRVLVEPGAHVSRGDTLIVLEAMKMELPVRAPRDGVVRAVHCKAGELVQPGITLLDLE